MSVDITLNSSAGGFPPAGHYSHSTTVLLNIDACLAGAGVSRQHLVSVRVYVTDINQWPTFNKIYGEWIGDFRPSRAVAGVAELHYGFALEVEAIALAPQA